MSEVAYTGVDNLEVMAEARNYNRFLIDMILSYAGTSPSVLDFGAGTGTFAREVRDAGRNVVCVEPDHDLQRRLGMMGLPCQADIGMIPPVTIDYIYSLNVLEHIENDAAAVDSLFKALKPGGRLFLYVPAFKVLFSSMDRKVGHFRRYRRGTLLPLLRSAGFEIERARYADSLGFAATLAFKAIGNDKGDIDRRAVAVYDRYLFPASRALDRICGLWFGKNIAVVARRPPSS